MKPFSLLLVFAFLPFSALFFSCGGSGRADGDTGTDGDGTADGDTETADGDIEQPVDCSGCGSFPGRYCFASTVGTDCEYQESPFVHSEITIFNWDAVVCGFGMTIYYFPPNEPEQEFGGSFPVPGCQVESVMYGCDDCIDLSPPMPFAWDPLAETVSLYLDYHRRCAVTFSKQACEADGDTGTDGDADREAGDEGEASDREPEDDTTDQETICTACANDASCGPDRLCDLAPGQPSWCGPDEGCCRDRCSLERPCDPPLWCNEAGRCVSGEENCGGACPRGYVCDSTWNQCVLNCPECGPTECCNADTAPNCYICSCSNPTICGPLLEQCCYGYCCNTIVYGVLGYCI